MAFEDSEKTTFELPGNPLPLPHFPSFPSDIHKISFNFRQTFEKGNIRMRLCFFQIFYCLIFKDETKHAKSVKSTPFK